MNIIQDILENQKKKNLENFDKDKYVTDVYKMFLGADLALAASTDIEESLQKIGMCSHERKKSIKTVKHHSALLIDDINAQCSRDLTCNFADLAEEINVLIESYLKNKLRKRREENGRI